MKASVSFLLFLIFKFSFVDLAKLNTDYGFVNHITDPERAIKTGWCSNYTYEIEFIVSKLTSLVLWHAQYVYDSIIRFALQAKKFNVHRLQLRFERFLTHNITGLESDRFEWLNPGWSHVAPHAFVSGLIMV